LNDQLSSPLLQSRECIRPAFAVNFFFRPMGFAKTMLSAYTVTVLVIRSTTIIS
jgi:hypothetical protein